ncbi:MAG: SDR family oxidoreductase [Anaerolineae bacterium]|nr:SDR family oxidoreductase [Anaerolineae bacterium]MDW8100489.1 SDR family oxidoreductase [Anaerolineae bacterium]
MDRKKALISGASSGIGKATAIRFAQEGCDVCLTARRARELEAVRDSLPAGHHLVCPGDYSDPATAERIGEAIRQHWGRLDVLVNCAGIYLTSDPIVSPLDEWRKPFDVMVNGAIHLTRMAVPLMIEGGRIIHITSIHGERVERGGSAYAMAKAALNQYCRALALELADRGILVNAIAPGFVDTPMSVVNGVNELETEWFLQNYVRGHHLPLRRAGRPEEIAGVAWFLAGPDASYITGQVITVDGGLTITF